MYRISALLSCLIIAHQAIASEQRQAGAHVHGVNNVQLAMDGNELKLTYQMPVVQLNETRDATQDHEHGHDEHGHDEHGHDEHGHDEHDHNEVKSITSVEKQLTLFKDPSSLFLLPREAECTQTAFDSDIRAVATHGDSEHDHGKESEHEHANDSGHQDVFLTYAFKCQNPNALDGVEITAFKTYDSLNEVQFDAVTDQGVASQRLTQDLTRANW